MDVLGTPFITMYAIWDAGITAGQVVLEGSPDNINWLILGTLNFSAGTTNDINLNAQAHRYIRTRISIAPVGGNVRVWLTSTGFKEFTNDAGWSDPLNVGFTGSYRGSGPGFPTGSSLVSNEKMTLSWNMDTLTSGGLMQDFSNNGFNGTIVGASFASGIFGRAENFAVGNTITSPSTIPINTSGTLSCWLNPSAAISPPGVGNFPLTIQFQGGGNGLITQASSGNPYIQLIFPVVGTKSTVSTTPNVVNQWMHIAGTWNNNGDGTTTIKIYTNGKLSNSLLVNDVLSIGTTTLTAGQTSLFSGLIDELQYYQRALTDSEILALANRA